MACHWPFSLYILFSLLFSIDFLRFFSFFSAPSVCSASPHPFSSLIGPLEFEKASLHSGGLRLREWWFNLPSPLPLCLRRSLSTFPIFLYSSASLLLHLSPCGYMRSLGTHASVVGFGSATNRFVAETHR